VTQFLDDPARAAAVAAARARIEPGMTIGLGSGRAVFALVDLLATTWPGPRPLRAVAASSRTEASARAAGIELLDLDEDRTLDLAVDGADEIDPALNLLKGGGGALLREKLVIAAARHVVIVAESPKLVPRLGTTKALPVEVVRFAWPTTRSRILDLLPSATLRPTPDGSPFVTTCSTAPSPPPTSPPWPAPSSPPSAWLSTACSPTRPTRPSSATPTAPSRPSAADPYRLIGPERLK
jgi:ribose 5-phosphate isomerase A